MEVSLDFRVATRPRRVFMARSGDQVTELALGREPSLPALLGSRTILLCGSMAGSVVFVTPMLTREPPRRSQVAL